MSEKEKRILELLTMANVTMACILDDKQANIILNLINRLQKENEEKDKVIDLMYQDIESEYLGTSYMEYYSLENYYRRAEEEND